MPELRPLAPESSAPIASDSTQQIDVSFSCVCPVIDHEFRHTIVKVAVDPRGDSNDNVMTKFIVNNRTDALETDINLFFYDLSNFLLSFVDASHKR